MLPSPGRMRFWLLQPQPLWKLEGRTVLPKKCHRAGSWKGKLTEAQHSILAPPTPHPAPLTQKGPGDPGWALTLSANRASTGMILNAPFPPLWRLISRSEKFSRLPGPPLHAAHCAGNVCSFHAHLSESPGPWAADRRAGPKAWTLIPSSAFLPLTPGCRGYHGFLRLFKNGYICKRY